MSPVSNGQDLSLLPKLFTYRSCQAITIHGTARWQTRMGSNEIRSYQHDDAVELAENLRVTLGRFVRGIKAQAGTPTTSQSETLSILDRAGPLTVSQLADRRNVKHQSMRLVAGHLESDGLISKMPSPADGRSQLLSITESGRAFLSRAREARTSEIAKLIADRLSKQDKRTLEAAIKVIERLC